jgi:zinc protease
MRSKALHLAALALLLFAAQTAHALLPIQHWETARGARVYFVQNSDLPMLDVSVEVPAGAGFDKPDKSGVANLTAHMLRLGAVGLDEDEIARRMADVGARLGSRFDGDRAGLSVRTLSSAKERRQALEILRRTLSRPEFPAKVLEREKARVIAALQEADTKPDTIAARTFSRMVYPAHPYGLRNAGEVATVTKIARDDLVAFHREHYAAERAVVAIMGDVSREEATAIAEALTADLPRADASPAVLPPVAPLPKAAEAWVRHPATQSHVLMGAPGIRRDDPDYFPLVVGNHVLGSGGFTSRLTEEVRQKRGLAYSAYSYFSPMLREGPFVVGLQTQASQAPDALAVVRKTVTDFIAGGPTPEELAAAKKNIIGGFPLRIDSNRKIHEYLALIGFYRLPLTYLDDFTRNVERVTAEQVKSAFQKHIQPDRMITVVVGASQRPDATN